MKNIIKTIVFFAIAISCKAQSPIIDIDDNNGYDVNGAYYKDTKNQLNAFEGTYVYTNGSTRLVIVLQKKTMSYPPSKSYYTDMVIGEYQYIENGVEKINTLSKLNITYTDQRDHTMYGDLLLTGTKLGCPNCTATEKRLWLSFVDKPSQSGSNPQVRIITSGGKPAIKFSFHWGWREHKEGDPALIGASLPSGEYILIKQ